MDTVSKQYRFDEPKEVEKPKLDAVIEHTERKMLSQKAAAFLGVNQKSLFNLLRDQIFTVPKGQDPFSDQELIHAVALIGKYELDPFTKQIHVTRDKRGRILTIIGYDGWVQLLNKTPTYDGFDYKEIVDEAGRLISVEYLIYDKERKYPARYCAYMVRFCPANVGEWSPWSKYPEHMLHIKALSHAARRAYAFGAVYTEDDVQMILESQAAEEKNAVRRVPEVELVTEETVK